MNENYLLFLASLIEYHFNDVQALNSFAKQIVSAQGENNPSNPGKAVEKDTSPLDLSAVNEISKASPFLKSILKLESCQEVDILSFTKVEIDSVSLEWVFGLGFDDHEENYVTLSNRNFSKLILDQFDKQKSAS